MSAIIVLTIGPVQSYISQARRTQDLWQGSRILSYLASKGVHYALHQSQAEVIYPSIEPDQTDNIPNRIVVFWRGDEGGAQVCAQEMENAIRGAWQALSANTLRYFVDGMSQAERETVMHIWQEQEVNWLECYWVVVPENRRESYTENLLRANAAMGARKLLRNFPQIHERGRKCSITGEHEALHNEKNVIEFWNARQAEQRNLALLSKSERLSAISTIKRFAHEEEEHGPQQREPINPDLKITHRYPSTSSIAAAPFKYDVLRALADATIDGRKRINLEDALISFIKRLVSLFEDPHINNPDERSRKAQRLLFFTRRGELNPEYFPYLREKLGDSVIESSLAKQFLSIDGDFLFDDTLMAKTIEEYSGRTLGDEPKAHQADFKMRLVEAQAALNNLIKAASSLEISRPQPYLVILSTDGDHMGKTLGVLQNAEQHKKFSETLANFARHNVNRIVEKEHLGRVVYAGGDDVLALLPVREALEVAEALRSEFERTIAAIGIKNHKGEFVTASTGLAYVHHTHNLQDAVRAANGAQKKAKEVFGRQSVAVEFLRRSGEPRSMGHKWKMRHDPTIEYVTEISKAFGQGLSRNLPYDLAQLTYSMASDRVPDEARHAELKRILQRRLPEEGQGLSNDLMQSILALLNSPYNNLERRWQNTQHWLELARFVAQKVGDV